MFRNPREQRRRFFTRVAVLLIVLGLFYWLFCRGAYGLLRIRKLRRNQAQLTRDLDELKLTEIVLKSDIRDLEDSARIRRILVEKLKMVPESVGRPLSPSGDLEPQAIGPARRVAGTVQPRRL